MAFRWGIVGYGWVARDHFAPALAQAGHELAGVVDLAPEARAAALEQGVPAFDSIAALVPLGVDAVYVATPNHRHRAPVAALADLALPTLCEKPLAATLTDAEAIAAVVDGKAFGTAFDQRHHPAHQAMRTAIADGTIGRVTALRVVYCCWVGEDFSPGGSVNWRTDRAAAGGGAVIDLALHGLDLGQMLLGEPLVDLHIALQRRVQPYAVDDGGMLTGRFGSGALLQSHVAYNCPEALPRRRLEVVGDRGKLVATNTMGQDAGGALALLDGDTGERRAIPFDTELSPFAAQAVAFERWLDTRDDTFDVRRDLQLMRLFDCAHAKAHACL